MIDLPAGYTARPLLPTDAAAVVAVMAAQQLRDVGEVAIELADIESDWARPSFDLGAQTIGVLSGTATGEVLVGYAEVSGSSRGDACVHPDHEGRGIGTALAAWMRRRARERGEEWIGMPVPAGSPGDRLLAALGYEVRWDSWVLALPGDAVVPPRDLPAGYAVREARPEEYEQCWTVKEDAFLEWSVRERESYADWAATVLGRPGFAPWNLRVVLDSDGSVVAMAHVVLAPITDGLEGYIGSLATRADQRGRGLAQALLADAFATARAHGAVRCALDTDSRTGALGLYEKVGMVVTQTWRHRGIRVTA